jgi:hypothetical protein
MVIPTTVMGGVAVTAVRGIAALLMDGPVIIQEGSSESGWKSERRGIWDWEWCR